MATGAQGAINAASVAFGEESTNVQRPPKKALLFGK
jgi:hypothetical protein